LIVINVSDLCCQGKIKTFKGGTRKHNHSHAFPYAVNLRRKIFNKLKCQEKAYFIRIEIEEPHVPVSMRNRGNILATYDIITGSFYDGQIF